MKSLVVFRSLWLLSFFLQSTTQLVRAAFDRRTPPDHENFDPVEADPNGNLTCPEEEDLQYLRLSTVSVNGQSIDPGQLTLQQLCAKPQYGGWGPGLHLGGFCDTAIGLRIVSFDLSAEPRVAAELASPRLLLYCQIRCYCNNPIPSLLQRESNIRAKVPPTWDLSGSIESHQLEREPFLQGEHVAIDSARRRSRITVRTRNQVRYQRWTIRGDFAQSVDDSRTGDARVSLDKRNRIECDSPLPEWPLPVPDELRSMIDPNLIDPNHPALVMSLNKLCSVSLLGGRELVLRVQNI